MRWNRFTHFGSDQRQPVLCADCGDVIEGEGAWFYAVYRDDLHKPSDGPSIPTDYYHDHCIRCDKCKRVVQPPLYEHRVPCDGR